MNIEISDDNDVRKLGPNMDAHEIKFVQSYLSGLAGKKKINPYLINAGTGDDCYLLCKDGIFWSVSYLERGLRRQPALFLHVSDAIAFFLLKVTSTPNIE